MPIHSLHDRKEPAEPDNFGGVVTPQKQLNHIRLMLPSLQGELDHFLETSPEYGITHRDILLRELAEVLQMGISAKDFEGAEVQTYVNGEPQVRFPISESDIEKLAEQLNL